MKESEFKRILKRIADRSTKENKMNTQISQKNGVYYMSPPSEPVSVIHPNVYKISIPMMGPAYFGPDITENIESLKRDSVSWDFTGCEEHRVCIDDIERFLSAAQFYHSVGVRHRRGIILHGPPGTGKSVIAKSMALRAVELGVPVFKVEGAGEFHIVTKLGVPCVVWIDEIDDVEDLTTLIDRLGSGCFIVGTTNYPKSMKERITKRPGRFDRIIEVRKMTPGMIRKLCKSYFIESAFEPISTGFDTITPAQFAEISLRHNVYGYSIANAVESVKNEFGDQDDNE